MADFFVRVELHGATGAEYEELHQRMRAAGFFRAIVAATGRTLQLPDAEYHSILPDGQTAPNVRDRVKVIADSVKPGAWVLAMKTVDWALHSRPS